MNEWPWHYAIEVPEVIDPAELAEMDWRYFHPAYESWED